MIILAFLNSPVVGGQNIGGPVLCQPFDSVEGLEDLAAATDVITYEFENVPVTIVAE